MWLISVSLHGWCNCAKHIYLLPKSFQNSLFGLLALAFVDELKAGCCKDTDRSCSIRLTVVGRLLIYTTEKKFHTSLKL